MPKLRRPPKVSRHKASGQAYVTWQKKRHYLGPYGSPEASAEYARFLVHINSPGESKQEAEQRAPSSQDTRTKRLILDDLDLRQ